MIKKCLSLLLFVLATVLFGCTPSIPTGEPTVVQPTPMPEATATLAEVSPTDEPVAEPTDDWRDVGTIDEQTRSCVAPTAAEFYAERQQEFGGSGGTFSEGSLRFVLENLPYGDCSGGTENFPLVEVTQCDGAIAFADSGGFTLTNEFYSTTTGELVFAAVGTDFNAFCKSASFDVSFGEKPTENCETTRVSYCQVKRDEILGLFDAAEFGQIVPVILVQQEK